MVTLEIVSIAVNVGLLFYGLVLLKGYKILRSENDNLTHENIQNEIELKRLRSSIEFERRDNRVLKEKLKWYKLRMDIKRKYK